MPRFLFICKLGAAYGHSYGSCTGLKTSAEFVAAMLVAAGIQAKVVLVNDNNDIDREVHSYQPTHVVIEALWVVPEKFAVLQHLHPKVRWIVRVHSDLSFLAEEGIAIEWLFRYLHFSNVRIAFNCHATWEDFSDMIPPGDRFRVLYLPNYYPPPTHGVKPPVTGVLRIGCFGAIRSLKNQLLQAVAAIRFADSVGRELEFHINSSRCEGTAGERVLKNLHSLFANTEHKLVEHGWMERDAFLKVLAAMDIEMAVSLTETFCIVAADAIAEGVPLIASNQIPWAPNPVAATTDAIIKRLQQLAGNVFRAAMFLADRRGLVAYAAASRVIWLDPKIRQ